MDRYVTGSVIRRLREQKQLTQEELAERLYVSGKAVSKWETGKGFPDVSLLEPLAKALGLSVIELLSGEDVRNRNRSANVARSLFYICPICGNVLQSIGEAVVGCCGITLSPLVAEEPDEEHCISVEIVEDEYYVSVDHLMQKDHYISFLAAVSDHGIQFIKLYPEWSASARFRTDRVLRFYACCNRHGMFAIKT